MFLFLFKSKYRVKRTFSSAQYLFSVLFVINLLSLARGDAAELANCDKGCYNGDCVHVEASVAAQGAGPPAQQRRRLWRLLVVARVPGQCHALSTATRWLLPIAAGELRLADDHAPPLVSLRCDDFPRRGDCFGVALLGDMSIE